MLPWWSSWGWRWLSVQFYVMAWSWQTPTFTGRTLAFNAFIACLSIILWWVLLELNWTHTYFYLREERNRLLEPAKQYLQYYFIYLINEPLPCLLCGWEKSRFLWWIASPAGVFKIAFEVSHILMCKGGDICRRSARLFRWRLSLPLWKFWLSVCLLSIGFGKGMWRLSGIWSPKQETKWGILKS